MALLVGALALIFAPPASAAVACPDPATVHAARLIEFQTMMMDVSVRCSHVGVTIGNHLNEMAAAHTTMFDDARERVRGFLASAANSAGRPAARASRHGDPLDRYMTMLGNRYGAGSTTPDRCHAFDAIAMSLVDRGNTDKLLTIVADSLIGETLLENLLDCPAKP